MPAQQTRERGTRVEAIPGEELGSDRSVRDGDYSYPWVVWDGSSWQEAEAKIALDEGEHEFDGHRFEGHSP
nr:hypothetical protein [Dermabacter jinjuensis]